MMVSILGEKSESTGKPPSPSAARSKTDYKHPSTTKILLIIL